jgi:hypothetical protein
MDPYISSTFKCSFLKQFETYVVDDIRGVADGHSSSEGGTVTERKSRSREVGN